MYKKKSVLCVVCARAKLLFCQSKPIAFFTFSLPSPSSDLKVPIKPSIFRASRWGLMEIQDKS